MCDLSEIYIYVPKSRLYLEMDKLIINVVAKMFIKTIMRVCVANVYASIDHLHACKCYKNLICSHIRIYWETFLNKILEISKHIFLKILKTNCLYKLHAYYCLKMVLVRKRLINHVDIRNN